MPGVLHLWGPAAAGPESDAAAIAAHVRDAGGPPVVVVAPSYWGAVRRGLLERGLAAAGAPDALVTGIDDELRGLEPPLAPRSVLVEVEDGRLAVTDLAFPAGPSRTRLTHAEGPPIDIVLAAAGFDPAGVPPAARTAPPEAEFLVAAAPGHPLVGDLRRRGHLAYPVPADLLGTSEVRAPSPQPRDDVPLPAPAPPPEGEGAEPAYDGADEPETGVLDIGELRRRAREAPARRLPRVSPWLPLGALATAAVAVAAAIVVIFPGPPDAPPASVAVAGEAPPAGPSTGAPPPTEAAEPWDLPDPDAPPPVHRLEAAGASVELPATWRLDDGAPPGTLAAVDGGPMRVLAAAPPAAPGLTPARLAAGLAEGVAGDPALGPVGRAAVGGVDVVTHEERPGDGTVVLWHHRVVGGRQVSVGCQFRGPAIPHVRPTCDAAVASARPA
ncbi:type VII secretion-associated protein [Corynebacterium sp. 335C]